VEKSTAEMGKKRKTADFFRLYFLYFRNDAKIGIFFLSFTLFLQVMPSTAVALLLIV
jgi:hypothetical protein